MSELKDQQLGGEVQSERRLVPYQPPLLSYLGDLRLMTLGRSVGVDESGLPNTFRT
ncbi:MAG: hypothetical protein IPK27_22685 [Rhodanobacteraceae bacterium]|jgi:hypothetical protein|nr:hypothetical protein [Rhodanobacteraceae bacterium]